MQNLYHFTTAIGLKGIFYSGKILATDTYANESLKIKAVCLTTDMSPEGHGLPDGRELTEKQALVFAHRCLTVKNQKYCLNHREFRLTISPDYLNIVSANDFHRGNTFFIKVMAATAYYPHAETEEIENLTAVENNIRDPEFRGKSLTWRYCLQDIPLASLIKIEQLSIDGSYQPVSQDSIYFYLNSSSLLDKDD